MQRQSLGSPGRGGGLVVKDDTVLIADDTIRRDSSPSSAISVTDDDEIKPEKPLRFHCHPEKSIHLIPILIIFCFFILYLSSHDPSPRDLVHFNGIKHQEKLLDSEDIDEIGGVNQEFKGSNKVLAIRSMRNLQEKIEKEATKSRSHRKIGDF